MDLCDGIAEGWFNQSYARARKEQGLPYFSDVESAVEGEWVRVVLIPSDSPNDGWWCVGTLKSWDQQSVVFDGLKFEGGQCPPKFKNISFSGRAEQKIDGTTEVWNLTNLEPESSPKTN